MRTMSIVTAGLVVALAGSALALDREGRREAGEAAFAEADADGSGTLDLDEFRTFHELLRARRLAYRFERADADDDGAVTLDELETAAPRRHHRRRF